MWAEDDIKIMMKLLFTRRNSSGLTYNKGYNVQIYLYTVKIQHTSHVYIH